jgi:arsenate reductase (thioredoxin)
MQMTKPRVLFLCTGNSARSQMAEAFLRKYDGEHFEVYSAGLEPSVINPLTVQVMEEIGIDMSGHYAKPLTTYLGKMHFGYLITVCSRADEKCPVFPGMGQRLHWPFDDPAAAEGNTEQRLAVFRRVRDEIEQKVQAWVINQAG